MLQRPSAELGGANAHEPPSVQHQPPELQRTAEAQAVVAEPQADGAGLEEDLPQVSPLIRGLPSSTIRTSERGRENTEQGNPRPASDLEQSVRV